MREQETRKYVSRTNHDLGKLEAMVADVVAVVVDVVVVARDGERECNTMSGPSMQSW